MLGFTAQVSTGWSCVTFLITDYCVSFDRCNICYQSRGHFRELWFEYWLRQYPLLMTEQEELLCLKAWYDAEAFLSWWVMVPPQPSHSGLEEFGEHRSGVNHKPWLSHGTSPPLGFDSGVMKQLHSIICDQTISWISWSTKTTSCVWLWSITELLLLTSSPVKETRKTWRC